MTEAAIPPDMGDIIYMAWTIIANAGEGDWTRETTEWQKAASRWRDEQFHPYLDYTQTPDSAREEPT